MTLFIFLLASSLAFAEEPETSPVFPEEIVYVPQGSSLTLGGKKYKTTGKTWLFPEGHYQAAITKAQKLEICDPALVKLRADYSELLMANEQEVSSCMVLLDESNGREEELTSRALQLETQNTELKVKLSSARKSSLIAWSITGSLLLGAGTAVYFALQ